MLDHRLKRETSILRDISIGIQIKYSYFWMNIHKRGRPTKKTQTYIYSEKEVHIRFQNSLNERERKPDESN